MRNTPKSIANSIYRKKHFQRVSGRLSFQKHAVKGLHIHEEYQKKNYAKNSTECGIVNPTISNNKPTVWGWVVLPFIYANIIGNSWWLILPQVIGYGLYYGPRNGWSSFPYVLPLLLAVQNLKKTARLHIACGSLSKCWSPQAVLFRILVGAHIFGAFFFWAFRYDLTHHFLKYLAGSTAHMLLVLVLIAHLETRSLRGLFKQDPCSSVNIIKYVRQIKLRKKEKRDYICKPVARPRFRFCLLSRHCTKNAQMPVRQIIFQ